MTEEAKEKALQELHRLEAMPPMSAEGTVSRTYIDWLVSVPWKQKSKEIRDLTKAEEVLNEDHYSLERLRTAFLNISPCVSYEKPDSLSSASRSWQTVWENQLRARGRKICAPVAGRVRDEADSGCAPTLARCPVRLFK
jgi:ATP-dependent Lon protease